MTAWPSNEPSPVVPHLGAEFYLWLWWSTEVLAGHFDVPGDVGRQDLYLNGRLAFRAPGDKAVTAVHTGDAASDAPESRAALGGGKIVHALRVLITRDDRSYEVTLTGPEVRMCALKLPATMGEQDDQVLVDRVHCIHECHFIVCGLWQSFAELRISGEWEATASRIRDWVHGGEE